MTAGCVTRYGQQLYLDGRPFRAGGINIYNANGNATGNSSYDMQSGTILSDELDAIGHGMKVFRAWFTQDLAVTAGVRDWTSFDKTLAVAAAHDMKVIATLCFQSGGGGGTKYKSWYQSGYKTTLMGLDIQTYYDYIASFATRYKDHPAIFMIEFMNEAHAPTDDVICDTDAGAVLKAWGDDIAALCKSIDPDHLTSMGLAIGCGSTGADYQTVQSGPDIDVIDYHDYGDVTAALPAQLSGCLTQAKALNKPMIVGECGLNNYADPALRAAQFDAKITAQLGAGVAGYLMWAYRNAAHGGSDNGYDIGPADPAIALLGKYWRRHLPPYV